MGVDLTLLPELYPNIAGPIYPHIVLPLSRRRDLWERITDDIENQRLNQAVYWPDDDNGLEERVEDPYGAPITFVTAHELVKVIRKFRDVEGEMGWQNEATLMYLGCCPPLTRVILWWH